MITLYGIPNCGSVKKAKDWLNGEGLAFEEVNWKKRPITRAEMARFVDQKGMDVVLNRRGMTWRKLGLKDQNLSDEQLLDQLLEHQGLMKRPVIDRDGDLIVGYDAEAYAAFF